MIHIKTKADIIKMKLVGGYVAKILETLRSAVEPGISTLKLNEIAETEAKKINAVPAFKGYCGYPFSLCTSVNNVVVHGLPSCSALNDGDIVSLDFGLLYNGFYGDAAITVPVGAVHNDALKLIQRTEESLYNAIDCAVPGNRLSDISYSVQSFIESHGYSVVRDFVGHGIGKALHEDPQVPNYGRPGKGPLLKAGMVLAIEPMVNINNHTVKVLNDGWTAVTVDGSLSAHFEHTVALSENGPVILTTQ